MKTEGVRLNFGKHDGELLTRVPASYLKYMLNEFGDDSRWAKLAEAELKRRNHKIPEIEISPHAVDRASTRFLKKWKETSGKREGLYSWLVRMALAALKQGKPKIDKIEYDDMYFVFSKDTRWPVLKSVMKKTGQIKGG